MGYPRMVVVVLYCVGITFFFQCLFSLLCRVGYQDDFVGGLFERKVASNLTAGAEYNAAAATAGSEEKTKYIGEGSSCIGDRLSLRCFAFFFTILTTELFCVSER